MNTLTGEMNLREAKKVLKSVTMACWWPCKALGRTQEDRMNILQEVATYLTRPCSDEHKRQVETAAAIYYRKG